MNAKRWGLEPSWEVCGLGGVRARRARLGGERGRSTGREESGEGCMGWQGQARGGGEEVKEGGSDREGGEQERRRRADGAGKGEGGK